MKQVKVVLLQRVAKLGKIGDVVNVKPGFARNYLLPQRIALRASKANLEYFESKRAEIEAANEKSRTEAEKVLERMKGLTIALVRQASEKGNLYGSVSARDIAAQVSGRGFEVAPSKVNIGAPIKELGVYDVSISLHPEVIATVKVTVGKAEEEAIAQAAGFVE